jgi:predicted NUDIX family NTP pyrophosphohydrolase
MPKRSAGILLYKLTDDSGLEIWLAHMGGPFWARKDAGAWSIPKGEFDEGEDPIEVALREFDEEMGVPAPDVAYAKLGEFRQSAKVVTAFAGETDFRPDQIVSNTFEIEWPPGSGTLREYPEIDDARWFTAEEARSKLVRGQLPIVDALEGLIRRRRGES